MSTKSLKKPKTSSPEIDQLEDIEEAQDKTNFILWINTGFTVLAGITSLLIAILTYIK